MRKHQTISKTFTFCLFLDTVNIYDNIALMIDEHENKAMME